MDEGRRNKDAGTKVLTGEKDLCRNVNPLDFLGYYWKPSSCGRVNKSCSSITTRIPYQKLRPREPGLSYD